MDCTGIQYARHAFERMFERGLSPDVVEQVIAGGEIIQGYPDDQPYPSQLILGWNGSTPVHVVVAQDAETGECIVVTAYVPHPTLWADDYRTRRDR